MLLFYGMFHAIKFILARKHALISKKNYFELEHVRTKLEHVLKNYSMVSKLEHVLV